jgi:acyl-CoA reductase-like NAD-dependent aldehyde dehydrogenase
MSFLLSINDGGTVPPGVLSILPGYGHITGKQIISHPLVRKVDVTVHTSTSNCE